MLQLLTLPLNSPPTFPPWPSSIIPPLRSCKTMRDLHQLHAKAIKTGLIRDQLVSAEVLRFSALSTGCNLRYARLVFDQMPEPNLFSWNTIIRAFSENDLEPTQALCMFVRMLCDVSVQPNRFTFPSVLKACARSGRLEEGKQVHGLVVKLGLDLDGFVCSNLVRMYAICECTEDACRVFHFIPVSLESDANVVLQNVLIDGYFRVGMVDRAREMFDGMSERSVISWNSMISRYAQIGLFKEAVDVFQRMQVEGVGSNYVTLVSVLPAIARLGALELGKWAHMYAEKSNIAVDDVLGSALIDMYSKCGDIDKALQVFEGLPIRNPITWSALIGGLAMHGSAEEAIDYFSAMEQAEVIPSDVVFIGVLNACSHAGLVDQGRAYFDRMINVYGLKPRIEHYCCMVDMLGRAGLLEEAEQILMNLPMKPDDAILKALLASCKTHGNIEMGTRVAKDLIDLAPHDGASYVLLSNMYASLGNWEAVAKVRLMMKDLDIRKDPGCSWITVNSETHEFVVEDVLHPRTREIYSMLQEITEKLRAAGYKSDTSQLLLNIEEEEKESLLCYHSEKIAVAFGLISTKLGTTLQVVKNLRVCGDCHSFLKLVSDVYGRRIVVRDRKRFHHFENGVCSCNDYW